MKVAVVGSRNLNIDIKSFIPEDTTEIITGGATGIDTLAEKYANKNGIYVNVIKPKYEIYGRCAPIKRNEIIVDTCDLVIAIWDGKSKGTSYVIKYAEKKGKDVIKYIISDNNSVKNEAC